MQKAVILLPMENKLRKLSINKNPSLKMIIPMKTIQSSIFILLLLISFPVLSQVGIGIATPNASAQLEISSTTRGLLIPRLTTAQRDGIASAAIGLAIYNTSTNGIEFWNGTAWISLTLSSNIPSIPYTGATAAVNLGSYDLTVNGLTIGIGSVTGSGSSNTALGNTALISNTAGDGNTATGYAALNANTTGSSNTSTGVQSMLNNDGGSFNTAFGRDALRNNTSGNNNVGLGFQAGRYIADGTGSAAVIDNSVLVGYNSKVHASGETNQIVIGFNAIGNGSNTVRLGNTSITDVRTSGTYTAGTVTYPNAHGSSGQVLSTTGSGTLSWITPSTTATAYSGVLPSANGGTGVDNTGKTITLGGNLITSGAYATTFTTTNTTTLILPTTGTLATLAGSETFSNKTLIAPAIGAATGTSLSLSSSLSVNGTATINGTLNIPTAAASGKILTSDISGNASWQTGSVVVYTEIHGIGNGVTYAVGATISCLATVKADNVKTLFGNSYGWDNTTKKWIAPFTGKYRVTSNVYYNPNGSIVNPRVNAYKNGTEVCNITSVSQPAGSGDIATSTSAIIQLNKDDYIIWKAAGSGGASIFCFDYHTFFRVESVE